MEAPLPFWHARRVLVTGCTGFLGTWVVRELLARGAEVTGLIRTEVPDSDLIHDDLAEKIWVVRGPVEDATRLRTTLAVHEIDTVFHLAAPADEYDPSGFVRRTGLHRVTSAARVAAPNALVVTAFPVSERAAAERAVAGLPVPVAVALLPTVFGPGDRRTDRLVPRTVAAVTTGTQRPTVSRPEGAAPHLFAPDAAGELLRFAEDVAADLHAPRGPADLTPPHCATGADVVAALTRRPVPARPVLAGDRTTALEVAARMTLDWYEARVESAPLARAA